MSPLELKQAIIDQPLSASLPAPLHGLSLWGFSRAANATSFAIPELSLQLDAGMLVHDQRPDDIFITHTHSDHVHVITKLKSRRKPPNIYIPEHAVELFERYILAAQELTNSARTPEGFVYQEAYRLIPLKPGDTISFSRGKVRYEVDVYGCDHSVPCLGYGFFEVRERLASHLKGLPGAEIGRLRAQGELVTESTRVPRFAFLGDTTPEVFGRHPEILELPLVITECSFLETDDLAQAHKTKHTHFDELLPILRDHPQTRFILTHLSLRYTAQALEAFWQPYELPHVQWWVA